MVSKDTYNQIKALEKKLKKNALQIVPKTEGIPVIFNDTKQDYVVYFPEFIVEWSVYFQEISTYEEIEYEKLWTIAKNRITTGDYGIPKIIAPYEKKFLKNEYENIMKLIKLRELIRTIKESSEDCKTLDISEDELRYCFSINLRSILIHDLGISIPEKFLIYLAIGHFSHEDIINSKSLFVEGWFKSSCCTVDQFISVVKSNYYEHDEKFYEYIPTDLKKLSLYIIFKKYLKISDYANCIYFYKQCKHSIKDDVVRTIMRDYNERHYLTTSLSKTDVSSMTLHSRRISKNAEFFLKNFPNLLEIEIKYWLSWLLCNSTSNRTNRIKDIFIFCELHKHIFSDNFLIEIIACLIRLLHKFEVKEPIYTRSRRITTDRSEHFLVDISFVDEMLYDDEHIEKFRELALENNDRTFINLLFFANH